MQKVDHIPAILFRELVGKYRHAGIGNAVGQPMKEVARSMLGGVRLGEHVHRRLGKGFGQHAIALALEAVTGHAVLGEQGRAVGDGNGIERDRRLAVGFRIRIDGKGRQPYRQGERRQQQRDADAPLLLPMFGAAQGDGASRQYQQGDAEPGAQHDAGLTPGGGEGEAE